MEKNWLRSEDAVSETIGLVLVLFITMLVIGSIMMIGVPMINSGKHNAKMNVMANSFLSLQNDIEEVVRGPIWLTSPNVNDTNNLGPSRETELNLMEGDLAITSAGNNNITSSYQSLLVGLVINQTTITSGQAVNFTANASGGTSPYDYNWVGLPSPCSGYANITVICSPNIPGVYVVTITATDGSGNSASNSSILIVNQQPLLTLVASSTGNYGYKANASRNGTYSNNFPASDLNILASNLLSIAELNNLSTVGDSSYVNQSGSRNNDSYIYVNFTLPNVSSINWITIKTITKIDANDTTQIGLYNFSNSSGKWDKVNGSSITGMNVTLTFNISSVNISRYTKISGGNLNFSIMVWSNGTNMSNISADYFEANVSYIPKLSADLAISPAVISTGQSVIFKVAAIGGNTSRPYNYYWNNNSWPLNMSCSAVTNTTSTITCNPKIPGTYNIGVKVNDSAIPNGSISISKNLIITVPLQSPITIPLNSITYTSDQESIIYENGAVIRKYVGGEPIMISDPLINIYNTMDNNTAGDSNITISIHAITVNGTQSSSIGGKGNVYADIKLQNSLNEVIQSTGTPNSNQTTVFIHSNYPDAWKNFFDSKLDEAGLNSTDYNINVFDGGLVVTVYGTAGNSGIQDIFLSVYESRVNIELR